ncbi:hypothetical protein AB9P05_12935 [Roseivirga sp. BDSF3-8]|uniref:hypothetical protein n=1 Tax=Roseivirga sp. BDSF3-8 TaxID=3241598 RepID=UPI0035319630
MKKLSVLLFIMCCTFILLGSATEKKRSTVVYYAEYNPTPGCQDMFVTCPDGYILGVVGVPSGLTPGQTYRIELQKRLNPTICQHYNLVSISLGFCP